MNNERVILEVNLDDVIPNRFQPREKFNEQALNELADSIKEHGVINPIVVRKIGSKYEIVAGERRYKASLLAGKTTIPAIVADLNDTESAEIALIENVQRKDLTPIEEARTYQTILKVGNMTQGQLAERIGINQSTVANKLRLLDLDENVQKALLEDKISERHARSLLTLPSKEDQKEFLDKIVNNRMTVRETDLEIKKKLEGNKPVTTDNDIEIISDENEFNNVANIPIDTIKTAAETPITNPIDTDIEKIKQQTADINTPEPLPNFDNLLKPEGVINNQPIMPETPTGEGETGNGGNAFRFIPPTEDETPQPITPDIPNYNIPATNETTEDQNINIEQPYVSPVESFTPVTPVQDTPPPTNNIPSMNNTQTFVAGDLRAAINTARQCVDTIEKYGFTVDSEEFDFENMYQIIIKINK